MLYPFIPQKTGIRPSKVSLKEQKRITIPSPVRGFLLSSDEGLILGLLIYFIWAKKRQSPLRVI
jgi:hypothetical protein